MSFLIFLITIRMLMLLPVTYRMHIFHMPSHENSTSSLMLPQQHQASTHTTPFGSLFFVEGSLCLRSLFSRNHSVLHTLEEVRVPELAHLVDINGLDNLLIVEQDPGGVVKLLADESHIVSVRQCQPHSEPKSRDEFVRQKQLTQHECLCPCGTQYSAIDIPQAARHCLRVRQSQRLRPLQHPRRHRASQGPLGD